VVLCAIKFFPQNLLDEPFCLPTGSLRLPKEIGWTRQAPLQRLVDRLANMLFGKSAHNHVRNRALDRCDLISLAIQAIYSRP
jgi:hypothetical protein